MSVIQSIPSVILVLGLTTLGQITQHQAININQTVNRLYTPHQGLAQHIFQDNKGEYRTVEKFRKIKKKSGIYLLLAPLPFQGSFTSRLTVADIGNFLPKHRHMNISITSRQKHASFKYYTFYDDRIFIPKDLKY